MHSYALNEINITLYNNGLVYVGLFQSFILLLVYKVATCRLGLHLYQ